MTARRIDPSRLQPAALSAVAPPNAGRQRVEAEAAFDEEAADIEPAGRQQRYFFEGVESPNGTIFPDVLLDRVMAHLTGAEFKVLAYIVRRTFGFKKDSDTISLDQICNGITRRDGSILDQGTGLARKTAIAAIHGLEAKGVVLCQRRSSPERGNLPTSFALRFKGQPPSTLGTNSHQGGGEMPHGGEEGRYQPGHLPGPALDTARHPQSTVVQPTAQQGGYAQAGEKRPTPSAVAPTPIPPAPADLWAIALTRLSERVGEVTFRTWLAPTRLLTIDRATATLEAPHPLAQRWIGKHLADAIRAELQAITGNAVELTLVATKDTAATQALPVSAATSAEAIPLPRSAPAIPRPARGTGILRRARQSSPRWG